MFLRTYGTTLGPVGIPMRDDQAFALDAIFKQLPAEDQRLRKAAVAELAVTDSDSLPVGTFKFTCNATH